MRGKDNQTASAANSTGITPAYAGKSHCHPGQCGRNGDHPRVCGEKWRQKRSWVTRTGSPPRMRGKAPRPKRRGLGWRITPAYAGKSMANAAVEIVSEDHPRVCGEKKSWPRFEIISLGSPPRMRGKVPVLLFDGSIQRITPAYAGKRLGVAMFVDAPWDHPRVCGEKSSRHSLNCSS